MAGVNQQIKERIDAFFQQYNAKNYDAYMKFYTDDCRLYHPNKDTVIGKQAVRVALKQIQEDDLPASTYNLVEVIQFSDEYAWVNGHGDIFNPDGSVTNKLKDGSVWKKVGGEWCLHRDFYNERAK